MKKIFYILSICVMTILQPSCDALDLAPEDYYGAGNFWKEASQPKAFMLGLHAQLRSYYDMFYTLGELRGGTQRVGTSSLNTSLNYADIRSQNISEDIPGISNWNGQYSHIMKVNQFIKEVEKRPKEKVYDALKENVKIIPAALGEDCGLIGAACLILHDPS